MATLSPLALLKSRTLTVLELLTLAAGLLAMTVMTMPDLHGGLRLACFVVLWCCLAIYTCGDGGYLVASDQDKTATEFEVFDRQSLEHVTTFRLGDREGHLTNATDGIDLLQTPLPGFPDGVLAACDGCGSSKPDEMDLIGWGRIADAVGLKRCPGGVGP